MVGSMFDQGWAYINKPRPWKLRRLKIWLWMLQFERAIIVGNRVAELEMDKKICRLKCRVLRLTNAWSIYEFRR